MSKRITADYLIGTFLLTYIMWGGIIAANQIGYLQYGTPVSMILFVIGGNAPPIVAFIVLKRKGLITGIKQFAKEAFKIRQSPWLYGLLIAFLALYFGVPALMQGVSKGVEVYIGILTIPSMILFGGLEELGWRYVLQASLEKRFHFVIATSITACIWAVWHLPLFFIEGTGQSSLNFGLFTIMVFGMSFALAAIYHISRSIWLCILFHSAINGLSSTWLIHDSTKIMIITASVMMLLSVLVVIYHKKESPGISPHVLP